MYAALATTLERITAQDKADRLAKETATHQAKLIAFVALHRGIFATPTSDGGIWIYIPHHNRNTGRFDVDRYKARTFGQAKARLGY